MRINVLVFATLSAISGSSFSQVCSDNISPTSSSDRFIDSGKGLIKDVETGLTWEKCSFGQTFDEATNNCTGSPQPAVNANAAFELVNELNASPDGLLGYHDWRIPNIKELASLIERSCYDPAINLQIFSSTPSISYISSTPDVSDTIRSVSYINFSNGSEFDTSTAFDLSLRLVRSDH